MGALRWLGALFAFFTLIGLIATAVVFYPDTPLPDHWNPIKPLEIDHPVTPLTGWKLGQVTDGPACLAMIARSGVVFQRLEDREESDVCHIRDRIRLTGLGDIALAPVETRCETALRLAFWAHHGLEPAAEAEGITLARLLHFQSYSCRAIRSVSGFSNRMSTHATADAIDIAGVRLAGGETLSLQNDWAGSDFFRAARDSACDWFGTVLGPEFNSLHADHFHLQNRGWGTCR